MRYPNGDILFAGRTWSRGGGLVLAMVMLSSAVISQRARAEGDVQPAFDRPNTASASDLSTAPTDESSATPSSLPEASRRLEIAKSEYAKGFTLARERNDYIGALDHFNAALCHVRLPIILFAIAQCKKTLGEDIEALFYFAESLNKNYLMTLENNLEPDQMETAEDNIEILTKRLIEVPLVAPPDDPVVLMMQGDSVWIATDLYGFWDEKHLIAGITTESISELYQHRNRLIEHEQCSIGEKTATKRMDDMIADLDLTARPQEMTSLTFLTKPGVYDFEFVLKSGRRIFISDKQIYGHPVIDLSSKSWPARVVVDNIPNHTNLVLEKRIPKAGKTATTIVFADTAAGNEKPAGRRSTSGVALKRSNTVEIKNLTPGIYDLTAQREGFQDDVRTLSLAVGQRETVFLDLKPTPMYRSWKFWIGMGAAAAAVAVGIAVPLAVKSRVD